jgi:hypothetical protein
LSVSFLIEGLNSIAGFHVSGIAALYFTASSGNSALE